MHFILLLSKDCVPCPQAPRRTETIMRAFSSRILFFVLTAVLLVHATVATDDNAIIPGQYIVFYAKNTDRIETNERLFFSSSIESLDDSFQIVQELEDGVAVAGITDEQYQDLLQDESVEKVIPVSHMHA